ASGASKRSTNRAWHDRNSARPEPNRRSRQPRRSGVGACRAFFCHPACHAEVRRRRERSRKISNYFPVPPSSQLDAGCQILDAGVTLFGRSVFGVRRSPREAEPFTRLLVRQGTDSPWRALCLLLPARFAHLSLRRPGERSET